MIEEQPVEHVTQECDAASAGPAAAVSNPSAAGSDDACNLSTF